MNTAPFLQGMGICAGLIVAIGAQNTHVLTQGIRRNHHLSTPLVCSLCDGLLILAGTLGMGTLVASSPALCTAAAWVGAAFLFWYGLGAFRRAFKGGGLTAGEELSGGWKKAFSTTLAVSLLNPHAWLDTIVLMGGISSRFAGADRLLFSSGAIMASTLWFFGLSLGGRLMAPLFRNPGAWRVLDGFVCLTLWVIAAGLLHNSPA